MQVEVARLHIVMQSNYISNELIVSQLSMYTYLETLGINQARRVAVIGREFIGWRSEWIPYVVNAVLPTFSATGDYKSKTHN